jgi:hypothetical protein
MCGTSGVSIPQPAPHPFRTSCLSGPHNTYAAFFTLVIEGRKHKELEPEKYISYVTAITKQRILQAQLILQIYDQISSVGNMRKFS